MLLPLVTTLLYGRVIKMSFMVYKKTNNTTYVYEATGYRDKEKGVRQTRKYLGRLDEKTGEIIPPKSKELPLESKTYGTFALVDAIAETIGLKEVLMKTMGTHYENIMNLAFYDLCEHKPMYLYEYFAEENKCFSDIGMSSQQISDFIHNISDEMKNDFFTQWSKLTCENECVAYDITSISSYSKLNEWVEYGYNRDGEDLPQINLGMLFGETSQLPIFFTIHQGGIKDVQTLNNMLKKAEFLNLKNMKFVMDKGFYSKDNIENMLAGNRQTEFSIGVPFSTNLAKDAVSTASPTILSHENAILISDDIIYATVKKDIFSDKEVYIHTFLNEKKYSDEKESLIKKILVAKTELLNNEHLKSKESFYKKYFNIRRYKNGKIIVKTKEEEISNTLKNTGYFVILSNYISQPREALELYRNKDCVEKSFDNLKNALDLKRLNLQSQKSMGNRLFIAFIALILKSHIHKIMKANKLYKNLSFNKIVCELKKIKQYTFANNKTVNSEIGKIAKNVLSCFGVQVI